RVDLENVKDTLYELSLDEQKKTLIKIIDKNQLYYNYSEIDDEMRSRTFSSSIFEQKKTLIKIIDKNQLYYNYSEIDDENVRDLISDSDYKFNKSFYNEGGE